MPNQFVTVRQGITFQTVDQVVKAMETIKSEVIAEFKSKRPSDEEGQLAISRFSIDPLRLVNESTMCFHLRGSISSFSGLEKMQKLLEETIPAMISLREETPWIFERLGIGGSTTLRNSIRENAFDPLADALQSDLSALLAGYRLADKYKATYRKIRGVDRLLFIIDDYEQLHESIGDFWVTKFLPALKNVNFRSVVTWPNRDREGPHGLPPPTPPDIRVTLPRAAESIRVRRHPNRSVVSRRASCEFIPGARSDPTPRRMPSHRSTAGRHSSRPFRPSARSRVPTMPSADFSGAQGGFLHPQSSSRTPCRSPGVSGPPVGASTPAGSSTAPLWMEGLAVACPLAPAVPHRRLRFVSLAPHLRATRPSDPTSR